MLLCLLAFDCYFDVFNTYVAKVVHWYQVSIATRPAIQYIDLYLALSLRITKRALWSFLYQVVLYMNWTLLRLVGGIYYLEWVTKVWGTFTKHDDIVNIKSNHDKFTEFSRFSLKTEYQRCLLECILLPYEQAQKQ